MLIRLFFASGGNGFGPGLFLPSRIERPLMVVIVLDIAIIAFPLFHEYFPRIARHPDPLL